jgi:hypothetical protein
MRHESKLYDDTEEVIRAIEELERSNSSMNSLPYRTLRDILIDRGIIGPANGAAVDSRARAIGSAAVMVGSRARAIGSAAVMVGSRARSPARGAVAVSGPRSPRSPRSSPSEILNALSAQPISLEDFHMREREMASAIHRESLNANRVIEESARYREERRIINRRIEELTREINNIDRIILGLINPSRKTPRNKSLHDLYALERLQKEEELMHLQDQLQEINKNIKSILRKYEDKRSLVDIVSIRNGGTRTRTRTRTKKRKWSLKYKRSIDCKHPKGFSQRQHCTGDSVPRKPPGLRHSGLRKSLRRVRI